MKYFTHTMTNKVNKVRNNTLIKNIVNKSNKIIKLNVNK
jgi:hypothetical protein